MSDTVSIKKILGNLLSHPMVVETGEDDIWKWHRWNNGIMECWGKTPVKTYTFTSQSGNGYYTSDEFTLPPGLFSTVDYFFSERAQGTGSTPNYTLISVDGRILDTTKAGVWIHSPTSGSQSLSVSLYVRGTWDKTLFDPEQAKPFYFKIADTTETAQVGFKRAEVSFPGSGSTNPPSIDYNSFTNYQLPVLEYSYNNSQWNTYTLGSTITLGGSNSNIVYFRGDNLAPWYDDYETITTETVDGEEKAYTHKFRVWTQAIIETSNVKSGGNIMSLRYKDFTYKRSLPCINTFRGLFFKCSYLIQAPILPAITLTDYCYTNMFWGTSITASPVLPATTMKKGCYASMLASTLITSPPVLPATNLANACYGHIIEPDINYSKDQYGLFGGCLRLTSAPELPATTLAEYCYDNLFRSCYNLTTPPVLPATNLEPFCYNHMFHDSGITSAPVLPATTLKEYCYYYMFGYCNSLKTPPALPATNLADYCYYGMFISSGLTSAPTLPATILQSYCYAYMFSSCKALTVPSALPATTLASDCYSHMFDNCTALTKIPKLPAINLADYCYNSMFVGSSAVANATSISGCSNAYRIPSSGTGQASSKGFSDMFSLATDTENYFTPSLNTTFYVSVPSF